MNYPATERWGIGSIPLRFRLRRIRKRGKPRSYEPVHFAGRRLMESLLSIRRRQTRKWYIGGSNNII